MIYTPAIVNALSKALKTIDIPGLGEKHQGKVRDYYILPKERIIITTDRQSAFDVILGTIPYKGAVLNQLAAFWFEKTKHIVPNHLVNVPHPNVLVAKNCEPIPVEMVVRGHISGVTKTSIWYSYQRGERHIYGIDFPDGLRKNQKLPTPVITPTTHGGGAGGHDERLTREEIIKRGIVSEKLYTQMEKAALALFDFGSTLCRKRGLILVDTKYEFGLVDGKLTLMDEIHTPDSSRFWIAETYKERFSKGLEPENFDKEFLRLWYANQGYRGDGEPPPMTEELIIALAKRYVAVYEKITGRTFRNYHYPVEHDIVKRVATLFGSKKTLTYKDVGDDYETKDPLKTIAQTIAKGTKNNILSAGVSEVSQSRGESAYVFDLGPFYGAVTQEGLGTKNLIADRMYKENPAKSYYDQLGIDTVATIVNDLITVGARPISVSPHWSLGNNDWLKDKKRFTDLVSGWAAGCTQSGAVYGGGETPTLKGIITEGSVELSGSAFGIIRPKKHLIVEENLTAGDAILLFGSSGIHTNGLSLARAICEKLPAGYQTKLPSGKTIGEALLTPSYIYADVVQKLFEAHVPMHYLVHITGHGWRKLMRAKKKFTYRMTMVPPVPEELTFLAKEGPISVTEMYGTFNMGAGFACFVSEKDVKRAVKIVQKENIPCFPAGRVEKGPRQVIIEPLGITFTDASLKLK